MRKHFASYIFSVVVAIKARGGQTLKEVHGLDATFGKEHAHSSPSIDNIGPLIASFQS
jgi:hypothetical protein